MQKMQAHLQAVPLTPVSNSHIFIYGSRYVECLNVTIKAKGLIIDRFLSALLNPL